MKNMNLGIWRTIALATVVLIIATMNSWGSGIFLSAVNWKAEISGEASADFPSSPAPMPAEWSELVESLVAHHPSVRGSAAGPATRQREQQIWDGRGQSPLRASIEDIEAFLSNNCLDDCQQQAQLANWGIENQWLESGGLELQAQR